MEHGQGMDDGQKLADVVGSVREGALMKKFHTRGHIHSTILHDSRISRTGAIYRDAVTHNAGDGLVVDKLTWRTRNGPEDIHLTRVVTEGLYRLLLRVKGLVSGSRIALDTQLAFGPRVTNARFSSLPHDIPLAIVRCHESLF